MTKEIFKQKRLEAGLTQQQLADAMKRSREWVMKVESGKQPLTKANEIIFNSVMQRVQNAHADYANVEKSTVKEFNNTVSDLETLGYSKFKPARNADDMNMVIVSSATTSSVSLELICEILSAVSHKPLAQVQARAKELARLRSQKLELVLNAMI